jgi:hypothetical protein
MVLDPASDASLTPSAYLHFPLWYQVEKQGFVDFNFAYLYESVARLSSPQSPPYNDENFVKSTGGLNWRRDYADQYRYFFVRHIYPIPPTLFAGAKCPPVLLTTSGPWALFERQPCGLSAHQTLAPK